MGASSLVIALLSLLLSPLVLAIALTASIADPASAQQSPTSFLTLAETEDLARRVDYEGLSEDEAARIGPEGAARLVEMLADPDEKPHHARILLALGIAGGEGVLEAMRSWAASSLNTGELDRDRFRAWQALPFALGRLAQRDPRAVAELAARFDAAPPTWSFRQFRGARLQRLERRAAASALAETRLPEAERVLDAIARRAGDPELVAHMRAVRSEAQQAPAGDER